MATAGHYEKDAESEAENLCQLTLDYTDRWNPNQKIPIERWGFSFVCTT